jgi:hypothetical protein
MLDHSASPLALAKNLSYLSVTQPLREAQDDQALFIF